MADWEEVTVHRAHRAELIKKAKMTRKKENKCDPTA